MKVKYTAQGSGGGHVDTDLALAMAMAVQDDGDSDDDFQPAFRSQALALRSWAATKGGGRNVRLERKARGGGGLKAVRGTGVEVGSAGVKDRGRGCKEAKGNERGVLKDRNSKPTGIGAGVVVAVEGDENGSNVGAGKVGEDSSFRSAGVGGSGCTDRRMGSSQCEIQGQSGNVAKFGSKRKPEPTGGLHCDGGKRGKAVAEGDGGELDSLSFDGDGGVGVDGGDEDVVVCTQMEAPVGVEWGGVELRSGVGAVDVGKKGLKRRYNIYDIVMGNHRTDRVFTGDRGVDGCEGDEGGEMETPGTAMRALVDEAELDYEALVKGEGDGSGDFVECPVCGIDLSVNPTHLVDVSVVGGREQHGGDCLMGENLPCGRRSPVREEAIVCPVCGVCIEELTTAQREEHTNACLEKDQMPCGRMNESGGFLGRRPGSTEVDGVSQLESSRGDVMTESIVCPVCGDCIEELPTAQREEHTNACLDKSRGEGLGEVAEPEVAQAQGKPDVGPVVTWLMNMNLGKYVDIFVKEEIDWDTLKWLTEEDLSSLGITALGPRRKIVCGIQELRKPAASTAQQIAAMQEGQRLSDSVAVSSADSLQGSKKSIADFFVPLSTGPCVPAPFSNTLAGPKAPGTTRTAGGSARNRGQSGPITAGGNLRGAGTSGIPTWMCIPGTSFRVDAFKYTTGNCSNWFLTHFHSDHYQGLTRGFRHGRIFCSSITARLVNLRIGVPLDRIQVLPLNETVLIDDVRVTFIDANHCPGSVMILFEPPNGKAVLHTGDFRFCSDMTCNEVLKACRITTLILDTTYCDPQYDFPKQDSVIQFVIDAIEAEAFNTKTLFLIGTYTIGKERIFLEVGKALKKYVYVGKAKQRLLDCMDLAEEDKRWLTTKDQESHIHVVPLWSVASFKRMGSISRHYHGRYNSIVAFSPTGWSFGKDKKRIQGRPGRRYQQGSIIRYEVPYSEHSSFTELKEFVQTIASENIVPSVISSSGLTADAMVASLLSEES